MEVTALCVTLLMTVLLLLVTQVDSSYSQTADEAFPQVVPNRQQHFEYQSVVVSCEGLDGQTGWRVMKKIGGVVKTCAPSWSTSTGPCQIKHAIPAVDNGEYWCELGGGRKTNSVNFTATGVSVILDSPVLPVMEGDTVTLRCRQKQTSSSILTAEFFKDGHFMESSSAAEMTIHSVSTSNEGLYKCSISGAGESPESWLAVRAAREEEPRPSPQPSSHHAPQLSLLLCIVLSVLALLLLVGLLRFRKHQSATRGTTTSPSSCQSSSSTQADTPTM
ncbi:low affinity immunoglobulin gamma Fc region receptor III-A-like [Chaetodon trifascialis]|uniref:low affinity immunoglobulin gamma Fc region receptor III-A-like n=1 Tax=Chaetodon trifascialis TaxID=109706 RepID=UPI0039947381